MIALSWIKSWRLWALIGAAALAVAALYWYQHQVAEVARLESAVSAGKQEIKALDERILAQQKQHRAELEARDQSLEARDQAAAEAEQRAGALARQLRGARNADPQLDECLGTVLPDGVIGGLPR